MECEALMVKNIVLGFDDSLLFKDNFEQIGTGYASLCHYKQDHDTVVRRPVIGATYMYM